VGEADGEKRTAECDAVVKHETDHANVGGRRKLAGVEAEGVDIVG
jgi:hypothetical protein